MLGADRQVAGVWSGQAIAADGSSPSEELVWLLSLIPVDLEQRSAFGSDLPPSEEDEPTPITGTYDYLTGSAVVQWKHRKFRLSLRTDEEGGDIWLHGEETTADVGPTVVCLRLEDEVADVHTSGVFVGQSVPDPTLVEWLIPVNPIRWSVCFLWSRGRVVGSGYFDDAADIPNQSLLFFTLHGTCNPADRSFVLTKAYTHSAASKYQLEYRGTARKDDDGGEWLSGTWDNPAAATFGAFKARRSVNCSQNVSVCGECSRQVMPGTVRYVCTSCAWDTQTVYCEGCGATEEDRARLHPTHPLVPETMMASTVVSGADSCARLILEAFDEFAQRPLLTIFDKAEPSSIRTVTYASFQRLLTTVALNLKHALGESHHYEQKQPVVLLTCDISEAYCAALLAGVLLGTTVVPVDRMLSEDAHRSIAEQTQPDIIIDEEMLRDLTTLAAQDENTKLQSMAVFPTDGPATLRCILYTSGTSSGYPKGAAFTEELTMPTEGVVVVHPYVRLDFQRFDPSYVLSLLSTLQLGGARALVPPQSTTQNGGSDLWEAMRALRPTHVGAPPSFWVQVHRRYLHARERELRNGCTPEAADALATTTARSSLGSRLVVATSGGAALPTHVRMFMRDTLKIDLIDLYGSRETGGIARNGVVYPAVTLSICPLDATTVTLREEGEGELFVQSPRLITQGYYNCTEETASAFVHVDGVLWYRTGDVGRVWKGPSGDTRVEVLDRVSATFKGPQGEWIQPGALEEIVETVPGVSAAFVFLHRQLEEQEEVRCVVQHGITINTDDEDEDEDKSAALLHTGIRTALRLHKVRPMEYPRSILLVPEGAWTEQNGLLTSTHKKCRPALTATYAHAPGFTPLLSTSLSLDSENKVTLSEQLVALLCRVLGADRAPSAVGPDTLFGELGGDSLEAATLVACVKDFFPQVELSSEGGLSIHSLYTVPLADLDWLLQHGGAGLHHALTYNTGSIPPSWHSQWEDEDDHAITAPRGSGNGLLLVGGSGFIGTEMIKQYLSMVDQSSPLFVLVRAKDDEAARQRVLDALSSDRQLVDAFHARNVAVFAGDVVASRFGLEESTWHMLCEAVVAVINNAAHVSMTLPYDALCCVNVEGTRTAIRFCVQSGATLHHISSIGALPAGGYSEEPLPALPGPLLRAKDGYGQSKYVAERLVHDCVGKKTGVRAVVYRAGAVGWSRRGRGTCHFNPRDVNILTLQLCAALQTIPEDTSRALHLIPVDFVSNFVLTNATMIMSDPQQASEPAESIYHLTADGPLFSSLLAALPQSLTKVSEAEWKQLATARLQDMATDAPLRPLLPLVEKLQFASVTGDGDSVLPREKAVARCRALGLGEWPQYTSDDCVRFVQGLHTLRH